MRCLPRKKNIEFFEGVQGAVEEEEAYHNSIYAYIKGSEKTFRELSELRSFYLDAIERNDFEEIQGYCFVMDRPVEVLFAGTTQATHDFKGNCLNRAVDLGLFYASKADNFEFSLLQVENKGVFVVSFPKSNSQSAAVIESLSSLSREQIPSAIVRFGFELVENIYFSEKWWNGLSIEAKKSLWGRALRGVGPTIERRRTDSCLEDDGIHSAN